MGKCGKMCFQSSLFITPMSGEIASDSSLADTEKIIAPFVFSSHFLRRYNKTKTIMMMMMTEEEGKGGRGRGRGGDSGCQCWIHFY